MYHFSLYIKKTGVEPKVSYVLEPLFQIFKYGFLSRPCLLTLLHFE